MYKQSFQKKKEIKAVKYVILRDIRNVFEHEEEENYYQPVCVTNVWCNNYVEYKSNGDRKKTVSVEKYIDKSRQYLKDALNNLKKYDTGKIQLTTGYNFIFSIDNDEEYVMHSKVITQKL